MDEIKLRGYTIPSDYEGTDSEKLQKALIEAVNKNTGRVLVSGNLELTEPIEIPGRMELLLDNAVIRYTGCGPAFSNCNYNDPDTRQWAFQEEWIRITSKNSLIEGNLVFENCTHLILDDISVRGSVTLEYVWGARILNCHIGSLTVQRGCKDLLIRDLSADNGISVLSNLCEFGPVIAKEPDIKNLIMQDFETGGSIQLEASEDAAIYNVQIDGIRSSKEPLIIGSAAKPLPKEKYFNLTAINLFTGNNKAEAVLYNDVKNCYFGE